MTDNLAYLWEDNSWQKPQTDEQTQPEETYIARPALQVYTSPQLLRLLGMLRRLNRVMLSVAIISFVGSSICYAFLAPLESQLAHRLAKLEGQMKEHEDLKNELSHGYSWRKIDEQAKRNNLQQAQKVEFVQLQPRFTEAIFATE